MSRGILQPGQLIETLQDLMCDSCDVVAAWSLYLADELLFDRFGKWQRVELLGLAIMGEACSDAERQFRQTERCAERLSFYRVGHLNLRIQGRLLVGGEDLTTVRARPAAPDTAGFLVRS